MWFINTFDKYMYWLLSTAADRSATPSLECTIQTECFATPCWRGPNRPKQLILTATFAYTVIGIT